MTLHSGTFHCSSPHGVEPATFATKLLTTLNRRLFVYYQLVYCKKESFEIPIKCEQKVLINRYCTLDIIQRCKIVTIFAVTFQQ